MFLQALPRSARLQPLSKVRKHKPRRGRCVRVYRYEAQRSAVPLERFTAPRQSPAGLTHLDQIGEVEDTTEARDPAVAREVVACYLVGGVIPLHLLCLPPPWCLSFCTRLRYPPDDTLVHSMRGLRASATLLLIEAVRLCCKGVHCGACSAVFQLKTDRPIRCTMATDCSNVTIKQGSF